MKVKHSLLAVFGLFAMTSQASAQVDFPMVPEDLASSAIHNPSAGAETVSAMTSKGQMRDGGGKNAGKAVIMKHATKGGIKMPNNKARACNGGNAGEHSRG